MTGNIQPHSYVTSILTKTMSRKGMFKLRSKSSISRDQVSRWEINFDALLHDPRGITIFTEFAKKIHAAENIEFWVAVNELRQKKPIGDKLISTTRQIFKVFISSHGDKQININDCIRKSITKNIGDPTLTIFDDAQENIYILMKTDIYPRLLRDEGFLSLKRENLASL